MPRLATAKIFYAYRVLNLTNAKAYIRITTSSVQARWRRHLSTARRGVGGTLHDAIRKHGESAFRVDHIACARNWDSLCAVERILIRQEKTFAAYGLGYNATLGGEGAFGMVITDAHRAKIGAKNKGKRPSDEARAKMSAAGQGKLKSAEHRAKIAASHTGAKRSPEACAKNGDAKRGKKLSPAHVAKVSAALLGRIFTDEHRANMSAAARVGWIKRKKATVAQRSEFPPGIST